MLKFAQAICYMFASLVIALFTLILKSDTFEPRTASAAILAQDLSTIRVWIVVTGLSVYSWRAASGHSLRLTLGVLTVVAWIMFFEDYLVLDNVLFVAQHPLATAVQVTRPVFLFALTYVAFKQWELEAA
ncbi:hypothetical protein N9Z36_02600 [Luminiphilus sp.]|nr:hypothetical protein [Luminiphilus sp.]MDB2378743.1 hypothetical protein [Luminiphilus sp.]MDB2512119.1 hypothetical protein [Luminiphilus sp.]MDB2691406.1 hypothetical protein [Luminiphilus sp.]